MIKTNRPEPAATYAHVHWDEDNHRVYFDYNGRNVIDVVIEGNDPVKFRRASDGLIQSAPVIQQTFIALEEGTAKAKVTFNMSEDAVVMKPNRARSGQAVIGSMGRPTIENVNGLYDILDDMLIDWHGQDWNWSDAQLVENANGGLSVSMEVTLNQSPWIINLRPLFYRQHLGYKYHRPYVQRPNTKAVAGWCSWEGYQRDITEERIIDIAKFFKENVADYGLEYIQVDDGYQRLPVKYPVSQSQRDAWMIPNDDFPSGLDGLTKQINDMGLKAGLWMSADAEEIEKEADGSDCRLRYENGEEVTGFWMRAIPDCLPETIKKHITPLYEGIKEAGFDYVKTDQIRHLLSDALQEAVRNGLLTNDECDKRFRDYMEACREALGDDMYYLSSWGVLTEVVGVADACRIAIDANSSWRAVRMQITESARWWHTQRILFLNDPDHLCVRTNPEWARSMLSLVSLSGQLLMLSDPIQSYDDQRIEMIQKTLPPLTTTTSETGPLEMDYPAYAWVKQHGAAYKEGIKMDWDEISDEDSHVVAGYHPTSGDDHPLASLWNFHYATDAGRWSVAYRFAGTPLSASTIDFTSLYLSAEKEYLVFDFWAQEFLGSFKGSMKVDGLPLGYCQVLGFREVTGQPQLIGSSRHVSMDAVSVTAQSFDAAANSLKLSLKGIAGKTESYFVHAPAGYSVASVSATGASAADAIVKGESVAIPVSFDQEAAEITVTFSK